jgi:OHCU decarboxylase
VGNREWSAKEQSGVAAADQATLVLLAEANQAYRDKFGYTFIICATGKSANQMLDSLRRRLQNHPDEELGQAAGEQRLITHLRLEKIVWPPA